jgi:uncharacterized protein YbjT (DUF2867 family)
MILVTGATGNIGGAVVRALLRAGVPVRALVREDAAGLPAGTEAVVGDLNRPESLRPALRGASAVFLLSGYDGLERTLELARRDGVEHVVLLSSSSAEAGDVTNAVARYHILSERAVAASGLSWTFLRPQAFMSNALRWRPQLSAGDVVRLPFASLPVATIHPDDLGEVAAAALLSDAHAGLAYRLSGPAALLPGEQLRILGTVLGRTLTVDPIPDSEVRAELSGTMPDEYVDAFLRFYLKGELDESLVLPTVSDVLGRPAKRFEEWAASNAGMFTG